MDRCPICDTKIQHAVVIVSEGSRGGHVAVVAEHTAGPHPGPDTPEEDVYER